ncbi:MAG TPA: hypothetical protein VF131_10045 [Blastocatellia bacterium]|nr:hypothetical protein [Blastocatellia bacterium]
MSHKGSKAIEIAKEELVGSISWGVNRQGIFLALTEVYSELNLDIVEVDSSVRRGRFSKMIIGRSKNEQAFPFSQFNNKIKRLSNELGFESNCFKVIESSQTMNRKSNVVVVLLTENRTGLLASLLAALEEYGVDIVDIDISVDEKSDQLAFSLYTYIPTESDSFFSTLKNMRTRLATLKTDLGLATFNYMVHSSETFDYIEKIDFEYGAV